MVELIVAPVNSKTIDHLMDLGSLPLNAELRPILAKYRRPVKDYRKRKYLVIHEEDRSVGYVVDDATLRKINSNIGDAYTRNRIHRMLHKSRVEKAWEKWNVLSMIRCSVDLSYFAKPIPIGDLAWSRYQL